MNRKEEHDIRRKFKVLKHADDVCGNVPQTCRHFGISRDPFYRWSHEFTEIHPLLVALIVALINYSVASGRVLKQSELLAILFTFLHNL